MSSDVSDFRAHFDSMYVAGIPRLLNDDGAFLSFLAVLTGTEALAGLYAPSQGTGERFRAFVGRFYPPGLRQDSEKMWRFRNAMVHSFNPGPYALTHRSSRAHLTAPNGLTVLNAEDFYAALLFAAHAYFAELSVSAELQANFKKRTENPDGGAIQTWVVEQVHVPPSRGA